VNNADPHFPQGPQLVEQIQSGDVTQQVNATSRTRKLLSREENPPIQPVIGAGLVPFFVRFLTSTDPQLQVSLRLCFPRSPVVFTQDIAACSTLNSSSRNTHDLTPATVRGRLGFDEHRVRDLRANTTYHKSWSSTTTCVATVESQRRCP